MHIIAGRCTGLACTGLLPWVTYCIITAPSDPQHITLEFGQRREAECSKRKAAELKKQLQERKERRFNEEMLYQELTNPHFVATNPPQDRQ